MGDQSKTRAGSLEERIAGLTPERRAILERALGWATPGDAHHPSRHGAPPIPRRQTNDSLPLSFAQQRLWFLDQFSGGSPFYSVSNALRIRLPLNVKALEQSYNEVVRRHEALRTTFQAAGATPIQVIADTLRLPLEVRDLRGLPIQAREAEAFRIAAEEVRRPFDLARGPLVRTSLIQLGAADYLLLLNMHHIVSDGWSMDVFAREITSLYGAYCMGKPSPLPELAIQYADFALWQREWLQGSMFDHELAYWRQQLKDLQELQLPTDRPRPAAVTFRGARHPIVVPDRLAAALQTLSQREGVTPFMTLLAAFMTLLHRYSGQRDIAIGAPTANRGRAELEELIGFFVNTVIIRSDVSGDPTFRELLGRVRTTALEAFAHQDVPFEKLVEELHPERDLSRNPLFQASFQVFNVQALPQDVFEPCPLEGTVAKFDLRIDMLLSPRDLRGFVEYSSDLFDASTIARLTANFLTLLEAIAANPDERISRLQLIAPSERQRLLVEWNDTRSDYPRECVHDLFAAQVQRSPDAPAVSFAGVRLTYRELNEQANRLARELHARGVGPEVPVGTFLARSADMVIGQLAVLKAGGAYVPMDPEYPDERLAFILEDSGARLVVTDRAHRSRLTSSTADVICIDEFLAAAGPEEVLTTDASAESLAQVMYTSGSTGTPKGIEIPHRAITRLVCRTNYVSLGPSDRVAQASNASFDASTFEIWGALLNGACVVGVSKDVLLSPPELASVLRDERITTLFLTTDLFHQLAGEAPGMFRSLRTLMVGGSVLNPRWPREVLAKGAPNRLLHVYGPTESTTFASWHEVTDVPLDAVNVPIGRAVANTQLYVLDGYGNLAPTGTAGELVIGGDGLARGYRNAGELTAEKFIAHPFVSDPAARLYRTGDRARWLPDGVIEFLGRQDRQVKVRGFRVELGEIEAVLRQLPGVKDCTVLARQDTDGPKRLVAYVERDWDASQDEGELRRALKERLPDYMVPAAFVFMEALPLTPTGKIDSAALAPPAAYVSDDKAFAAPVSAVEKTLARIWAEVLGLERVDIHDNFFQLGGDSIISIQIIVRAKEAGLQLTLRQLFHNPTVAELAAVAGDAPIARAEQGMLEGDAPLTPIQCWWFEQDPAYAHHFNQSVLFETPAGLDSRLLARAWAQVLGHHDALRLGYQGDAGRWRQFYRSPSEPVPFSSVDLRATPAARLRDQIEQAAAAAQGSLNLELGPIARLIWFDLGDRPGRLLFVVHHLAVDSVSWSILSEDFWKCYEALARQQEISLPAKTASMRQWAERLIEYAQSTKASGDLEYWLAAAGDEGGVPVDLPAAENLTGSVRVATVTLEQEETRALLQDAPRAYQTQINDVLLTALAQTLGTWTGKRRVRIDLEGHGREPLFDDVDLTRTVGWFTTIFPVRLELASDDPGAALRSVKEQLRKIPHRGLTYGVLRYLSPDSRVREQLSAQRTPDVSFNYLGQHSGTPAPESNGPERDARNRRAHLLEIDGVIANGRLQVQWRYSDRHHRPATIEGVADEFIRRLRSLIAHCIAAKAGGFTPSDFAAARVSQKDLDKLLAAIDRSGGRA
jgi:amino acid adenylation domain-containing protein/non-ribosomal peptide synthase protein (TIGR01720 family)